MRTCIICKKNKDVGAFIGYREQCRLCWLDLTREEKDSLIIYYRPAAKTLSQGKYESSYMRKKRVKDPKLS